MSVLGCLLLLAPQSLEAVPSNVEVRAEVRILARDAAGLGIEGITIHVSGPGAGTEQQVGVTGAGGTLVYIPEEAGEHGLTATIDGIRCRAPLFVARSPWRWLIGPVGLVAGVALLVAQLRWFRSGRRAG